MEMVATNSSLYDILHALSQGLLIPDIILLLVFAGYALFSIGSVLVEFFTERRNFKGEMPRFLASLMGAKEEDIPGVITSSGLLNRQKIALLTVYDYRTLPGDSLMALVRRTVDVEETRYDRITGRNNMAAKIAPMLGLMGTLIPLGPGIAALGEANTEMLSNSLLVAFDTTVAGLVVAAICLAIGKIRSNWYGDYLSALDSGMATILQKIEDMRESGEITVEEPTDYAFMYEKSLGKDKGNASAAAAIAEEVAAEADDGEPKGAIELPGVQGGPLATAQKPGELVVREDGETTLVAQPSIEVGDTPAANPAAIDIPTISDAQTDVLNSQKTQDFTPDAQAVFAVSDGEDASSAAAADESSSVMPDAFNEAVARLAREADSISGKEE